MEDAPRGVLVVDDDRRIVRTTGDILTAHGYAVQTAFSAEEAVARTREQPFDCVLMDIRMAGIDGISALQMIKRQSPDQPVVLMSAFATEEQAAAAKRKGAYAVLTKPFDVRMVLTFLSLLKKEESVLVVDDDPQFCRSMAEVLQARSYRVESEGEPKRVLGLMEREYRLVVVLDVALGGAKGLEVLKEIRETYPTKPVLLVTAHEEKTAEAIRQGLRIGAVTCFSKPLPNNAVIDAIDDIRRRKLAVVLGEPYDAAATGGDDRS